MNDFEVDYTAPGEYDAFSRAMNKELSRANREPDVEPIAALVLSVAMMLMVSILVVAAGWV